MFNLEDQKYIKLLDLNAQIYTESDFNCKHIHLDSKSDEKVFMVAFRTIPEDSTGVAHILEHTALCGSKKYPVRDPFFMMIRRSLNTFMNAFTSSDWTAYPFATLNDKDFKNLLSVYLDSSFFPNLDELDFLQEGHRLEFNNKNPEELEIKGVVYNEMKGAMSSVSSQLWEGLSKHLYTSSTYKHNSGGSPENIIDLTHEYLVDFHKRHYHPSNATFFTFGNINPEEIQTFINENVLEKFEPSENVTRVQNEDRLDKPKTITEFYNPVPGDENNHHVVLSWLLGESHDPIELLESYLISNILLDNSASPLRKVLENTDLGKSLSPLTGLETDHKELVFAAGLEGVRSGKQKDVEDLILKCLKDVVKNGIPKDHVDSSLHQLEIRQREISGSGMPFGLQIMLGCLPACIHNDDPLKVLDLDSSFSQIKEKLKSKNYIENLISEKIINNQHRVNFSLAPDIDFNNKKDQKIKDKIEQKSKKLSSEEKEKIVQLATQLKMRQESIDNPEILPKVTKQDIPLSRSYAKPEIIKDGNIGNYFYKAGTNGITYHSMIFPCDSMSLDEFKVSSLFANTLTDVGLGDKDYEEVQKIQSAITGGISSNFVLIPDEMGGSPTVGLKISSKSLEVNESEMQSLMIQTIKEANFRDKNRINDMLNFISSSNERSLIQNGHVLAMSNAGSQINNIAATNDIAAGIKFITNTKHLANDIHNNKNLERYIALLESIKGKIIESPIYTFTASSLDLNDTSISLQHTAIDKLHKPQNYFDIQDQSIGWITGAQVCYCAEAFPTVDFFHQDAPALTVLGAVLRNGYLHSAIREKGGAYGSGAIQDSNNMIFKFFSYRDPRCTETFDDFKKSIAWSLKKITKDHLEEGILSIISTIDKPLSPYGEAMSDFTSSLDNKDPEKRIQFRTKVKECTVKDLINVSSKYLLNDSAKSLIAGENYIEEMKRLNFKILNI